MMGWMDELGIHEEVGVTQMMDSAVGVLELYKYEVKLHEERMN